MSTSSLILELKRIFAALGMGNPQQTPRYRTIPQPDGAGTAGANVTLTSNVAADTWGNWAQLAAAADVTQPQLIVGIQLSNPTAVAEYQIDIGTGAAAAETSITGGGLPFTRITAAAPVQDCWIIWLPFPIPVPAATRIAARCQDSAGGSSIDVKLITLEGVGGEYGLGF